MTAGLGAYAGVVLGAYAVSLAVLVLVVAVSVVRARRVRADLAKLETRR